jgi:hypothetical protein
MFSRSQPTKLFTRFDLLLAILAGLLSLSLYARTLVPWPLPGDSGEFQVLAYELGVAHTTGSPVYLLLAHLFQRLVPLGDVAYRVNLFSAFMGGLTIGGVYLAGWLLSGNRWAGLFGALSLAVGFTFWSQALIAEVYTAGAAFLVAVFVLVVTWYHRYVIQPHQSILSEAPRSMQGEVEGCGHNPSATTLRAPSSPSSTPLPLRSESAQDACSVQRARRPIFFAGLIGGLGLGVHGSIGVFALAVGVFLLLNWKRRKEWLFPALGGAVAGVVLYTAVFLVVDLHAPPANIFDAAYGPARSAWGLTKTDLHSPVARIVFLASARQWRTALFVDPLKDVPEHLGGYFSRLPREFFPLTLFLAVLGLVVLLRRDKRLAAFMLVSLLLQWAVYFNYRVGDIYVFYIPTYIFLAILAAVGLGSVLTTSLRGVGFASAKPPRGTKQSQASQEIASHKSLAMTIKRLFLGRWQRLLPAALVLAVTLAGIVPMVNPYRSAIWDSKVPFLGAKEYLVNRGTEGMHRTAVETVRELDRDAIVFTDWNWLYLYYYAAHVEQGRTDLRFIETYPRAEIRGLVRSVPEFVLDNFAGHPIYFSQPVQEITDMSFTLRPVWVGPTRMYKVEYLRKS